MRNYDLSPLLRQWIGFDKLAFAAAKQRRKPELPAL